MDGGLNDLDFLSDCAIHVFDDKLNPEAAQLAMVMGSMVTDEIVPHFTTHVIAEKITPILSQHINSLAHRTAGSAVDKKMNKNLGSWLNIQVVTIDWLR